MTTSFVQRPPAGPVAALLSKPVQAKLDVEALMGDSDHVHASHIANMPVFFDRERNNRSSFMDQRHPAILAHANFASPLLSPKSPYMLGRDGKFDYPLLFLGVTRDSLPDGKAALEHPDAAGRFTVDTSGVVTILQPKEIIDKIPLGSDLYWTSDTFDIGSSKMKSFVMSHVPRFARETGLPYVEPNDKIIQPVPFGRLVEKRSKHLCEARVLLYSDLSQLRTDQSYDSTKVTTKGTTIPPGEPVVIDSTENYRSKSATQTVPTVAKQTTTAQNLSRGNEPDIQDATVKAPPPKKSKKSHSKKQ